MGGCIAFPRGLAAWEGRCLESGRERREDRRLWLLNPLRPQVYVYPSLDSCPVAQLGAGPSFHNHPRLKTGSWSGALNVSLQHLLRKGFLPAEPATPEELTAFSYSVGVPVHLGEEFVG